MIYISSSAMPGQYIENCLDQLISIDIRNIELSGGTSFHHLILDQLIYYKQKYSLDFLVHNYFPPPRSHFVLNIASTNENHLTKSLSHIRTSIKFANQLGVDRYSVHAGYSRHFRPSETGDYFVPDNIDRTNNRVASEIMYQSLVSIKKIAAEYNIRIALENLFPIEESRPSSLLTTPEDIFQYLDFIDDDDNVGILLDLGHLFISASQFDFNGDDFIDTLKENYYHKLFGIHLSSNDGEKDSHDPLSNDCWPLRAAKELNLDAKIPVTLESRGLKLDEIRSQYDLVKNTLELEN